MVRTKQTVTKKRTTSNKYAPGKKRTARETYRGAISGMNAAARVAKKITVDQHQCAQCDKVYKNVRTVDAIRQPSQFPGCCPRCVSKQTTAVRKQYTYKKTQTHQFQALILGADGTLSIVKTGTWESSYDAREFLDPEWEAEGRRMPRKPKTLSTYPDWVTCTVLCASDPPEDAPKNPLVHKVADLLGIWNAPTVYGDAVVLGPGEKWIHASDVERIRTHLNKSPF